MNIRPSAAIRNNYNDISNYCKETGEPVYLAKVIWWLWILKPFQDEKRCLN